MSKRALRLWECWLSGKGSRPNKASSSGRIVESLVEWHLVCVGQPTIDAQFINNVLNYYHSPASGKGQTLYNDGVKYNINPAYALAFFLQESTFGTKGVATVTHALGNIRANVGDPQYKGYRSYDTWEEGFTDWYQLIAEKYVGEWHLSTVDQIVPVYAPSEDHNNEAQYIQTVKWAIERWRNGYFNV